MPKSDPSTFAERSARARERRLARQPSLRAASGLPRQTPECIRKHLKELGIYQPWVDKSRPTAQALPGTSKASRFRFNLEVDSDTELVIVNGPSSENKSGTGTVIVGGSSRRSDNMPTTPKVKAKLRPDDGTLDKSLSQGEKITFIDESSRKRDQYLATVTNSEKVSKAKEGQFWLERRATSTIPFREGTYTTTSEIKRIVTGTCARRRKESIRTTGCRPPVMRKYADLQHAMDRWIPIWKLRDALSHLAKSQTLFLEMLDKDKLEHNLGLRSGPADGPFTPIILHSVVQEALDKYVESLKQPWEDAHGEATYPGEGKLWPPHVSTGADITDATTDDDDDDVDDKDTTPSVQGSHAFSRGSNHSVLRSHGQQDAPGAVGLQPLAEIVAHTESPDTRGETNSEESNGEPSPQRKTNFEEKWSANMALIEEATGIKSTLAVNPPPKPRQPRKSESKSRPVSSSPGERRMTRAQSAQNRCVGRGQDTPQACHKMKEAAIANHGEAASDNSAEAKGESPGEGKRTAPAPLQRTTNHAIHPNSTRPPNRAIQSIHNCAEEDYVGTSSSHVSPYFQGPSAPSRYRPHIRKDNLQVYDSENGRPAQPSWDQQGWEQKGSLVNYSPRREATAHIINAPGGDREVATVIESPRGSHTYFDENGEPSRKWTGDKSTYPGSFRRTPSRPLTDRTRFPSTRGSVASSSASSGLFVKTPEGKQCHSDTDLCERHISRKRPPTSPFKREDSANSETSKPDHFNGAHGGSGLFLPEANPGVEAELTTVQLLKLRKKERKERMRAGEKPPQPCAHCQQDHWSQACPTRKAEKKVERKKRKAANLAETQKAAIPKAPIALPIKAGKRKAEDMVGSNTIAQKGPEFQSIRPAKRAKYGAPPKFKRSQQRGNFADERYWRPRGPFRQAQMPSHPATALGLSYNRSDSVATDWVRVNCSPKTQARVMDRKYVKTKQKLQSARVEIADIKEENERLRGGGTAEPYGYGSQN